MGTVPDKPWKQFERRVARYFGMKRRGADYGDREGGKSDLVQSDGAESTRWSVECKHLGRPGYAAMLDAARQAEAAAKPGQEPVAVIGKTGQGRGVKDALVVQRLETFAEWRLSGLGREDD